MKQVYKDDQPSLDVSHKAITSEQLKYDQEIGSKTMSTHQDVPIKNSKLCGFSCGIDLTLVRMVLAEALGTFILMFCICGIIASMHLTGGKVGLLEYAITAALTVIVVVFSIGTISGAHVNPAVTIAFAVAGPFPWSNVPLYILAQIGGSVLATYAGKLVYGIKSELMITRPLSGCASSFWVELIAAFIILFLSAALINEAQSVRSIAGFAAGVAIGLGVLITGPISGGSMNPARSLGPAIISWKFDGIWIYLTAPTIGAVAGVLSFRALCLQCKLSQFTFP
ncbi:hypothetical protein LguiA_030817 [Lonicera macranthoides]